MRNKLRTIYGFITGLLLPGSTDRVGSPGGSVYLTKFSSKMKYSIDIPPGYVLHGRNEAGPGSIRSTGDYGSISVDHRNGFGNLESILTISFSSYDKLPLDFNAPPNANPSEAATVRADYVENKFINPTKKQKADAEQFGPEKLVQQPTISTICLNGLEATQVKWETNQGPDFVIFVRDGNIGMMLKPGQQGSVSGYEPKIQTPIAEKIA